MADVKGAGDSLMQTKTKTKLVIEISNLVISKYPVAWKAGEIALATKANIRTVERALKEMTESGLLEKRHHSYTLHTKHINQIYGAKWYLRQQTDKDVILGKKEE